MAIKAKWTKNRITYTYSGDLHEAIQEAEKELEKKSTSQNRVFLLWQYERAKKAYEAYEKRISELTGFINLAKEEIEKRKAADPDKGGETNGV